MGSGPRVSIVRCADYSVAKDAVREAIALIGGLENVIFPGAKVLLKPNVLAAVPPDKAVTTHPSIVEAMCELVIEAGGVPIVGDGAGITHPGVTDEALDISGIREAAQRAGAEVLNFETSGYIPVDVENSVQLSQIYYAKPVLDADVVISLPKLKTHELTKYTGAVKNMFGALPLKFRKQAHVLGKIDLFADALVDVYSVKVPHLAVMDGVVGMEGNGPALGHPVNSHLVMASFDPVSLDIVASKAIGLDPMTVPTNAAALARGFGHPDPEVVGLPPEKAKIEFAMPGVTLVGSAPPFLVSRFGNLFTIRPFIDTSSCTLCGSCVLNCSPKAIEQEDGELQINDKKCILCYCCRELCPSGAVEMKSSLFAKVLLKIRNRN
ncbi:DUF362 domain-containing protein [Methanococcoides sp. SA1]|nr:DUF362 domain-containing protein [Methanococcoides sp. SA1]